MQHISRTLSEGNPRSLEKTVVAVKRDPSLFEAIVSGLSNDDPLVRRHAADVVEQISRTRSTYLSPYKDLLIERATHDEPQVRLLLTRLLPRLSLEEQERAALFEVLQTVLSDASVSDLLKITSLQTLVTLSENDSTQRSHIITLLEEQVVTGIPANQNLAKCQLIRLTPSNVAIEGQQRKRTSFRERWQRSSPMWVFSDQLMKASKDHHQRIMAQEQERRRQAPPTLKKLLKELGNFLYGVAALAVCIVFALLEITFFSGSLFDYAMGIFLLAMSLLAIWLLGFGATNLVKMGVRLYQLKRAGELAGREQP